MMISRLYIHQFKVKYLWHFKPAVTISTHVLTVFFSSRTNSDSSIYHNLTNPNGQYNYSMSPFLRINSISHVLNLQQNQEMIPLNMSPSCAQGPSCIKFLYRPRSMLTNEYNPLACISPGLYTNVTTYILHISLVKCQ